MTKDADSPAIEFFTTNKGLLAAKDLHPKPTKMQIPDWFKDISAHDFIKTLDNGEVTDFPETKTVRSCPSFPDYFSQGYVIPMWTDVVIRHDEETKSWSYLTPSKDFTVSAHTHDQFLSHVDANFLGRKTEFIFKFISPWTLRTPSGYSVLQLPMFYHFNDNFSVLPGIVDTDTSHEINQQVAYHGGGKDILIPRGTPIAQYIPFKRQRYSMTVSFEDESMEEAMAKNRLLMSTKFTGAYSEMRRDRDSKQHD